MLHKLLLDMWALHSITWAAIIIAESINVLLNVIEPSVAYLFHIHFLMGHAAYLMSQEMMS